MSEKNEPDEVLATIKTLVKDRIPRKFGLDPVNDQRLAGLIMWIPGGLVHGAAAVLLFYRWLKSSEGGGRALPVQ